MHAAALALVALAAGATSSRCPASVGSGAHGTAVLSACGANSCGASMRVSLKEAFALCDPCGGPIGVQATLNVVEGDKDKFVLQSVLGQHELPVGKCTDMGLMVEHAEARERGATGLQEGSQLQNVTWTPTPAPATSPPAPIPDAVSPRTPAGSVDVTTVTGFPDASCSAFKSSVDAQKAAIRAIERASGFPVVSYTVRCGYGSLKTPQGRSAQTLQQAAETGVTMMAHMAVPAAQASGMTTGLATRMATAIQEEPELAVIVGTTVETQATYAANTECRLPYAAVQVGTTGADGVIVCSALQCQTGFVKTSTEPSMCVAGSSVNPAAYECLRDGDCTFNEALPVCGADQRCVARAADDDDDDSTVIIIVFGVLCGVLLIVICAAVAYLVLRKSTKDDEAATDHSELNFSDDEADVEQGDQFQQSARPMSRETPREVPLPEAGEAQNPIVTDLVLSSRPSHLPPQPVPEPMASGMPSRPVSFATSSQSPRRASVRTLSNDSTPPYTPDQYPYGHSPTNPIDDDGAFDMMV